MALRGKGCSGAASCSSRIRACRCALAGKSIPTVPATRACARIGIGGRESLQALHTAPSSTAVFPSSAGSRSVTCCAKRTLRESCDVARGS